MKEDIKNLEEIINLSKEEIKNNDENITAILDLEDLKSLQNLLTRYKQLEEENKNTMPIKLVLDMIDDLDKRRDIQKDIEPITGYWSKRAMLKKILKQAGFDYSKYKKEKEI